MLWPRDWAARKQTAAASPAAVRIGTSGWVYQHWRQVFYPSDLAERQWLEYYSRQFETVEVNYPFYRLPSENALAAWRQRVPPGFVFAAKGSRYITHRLRLRNSAGAVGTFLGRAEQLGEHLGPVLWQLPPQLTLDQEILTGFLAELPRTHPYVFEFRHASWHTDAVYEVLEQAGCHLCIHDWDGVSPPKLVLAHMGYVRLHGSQSGWNGRYGRAELEPWAAWIDQARAQGSTFYVYFNNDAYGNAVLDARELVELLS
jgi:uncharacterized protein YecE (DUF72 family)